MARRLPSFPRKRLRRLELAALLHDYGKLRIPAALLNKAGPLTPDEWGLVRMHPAMGAADAPVDEEFVETGAILWHHKRFDGTGYPDGELAGDRIPLEARITAVADVFDALCSPRSYRPGGGAMTPCQALDVLRAGAGAAFDPAIVTLFETIYLEESARMGGAVGIQTLALRTVISVAVERARALLRHDIGPFDPDDPLNGRTPPPGLEDRLVERLVRVSLDAASARNVVRFVLRQPLADTFAADDLSMGAAERAEAVRRAGNHEETVLVLKEGRDRPGYLGIVVFLGRLWLCVGEPARRGVAVALVR
jgi:hypothetical protein